MSDASTTPPPVDEGRGPVQGWGGPTSAVAPTGGVSRVLFGHVLGRGPLGAARVCAPGRNEGRPQPSWWPRVRRLIEQQREAFPSDIDPAFLGAWIENESSGNNSATSSLGEVGFFQIHPAEIEDMVGAAAIDSAVAEIRASDVNGILWGGALLARYGSAIDRFGVPHGTEVYHALLKVMHASMPRGKRWLQHVTAILGRAPETFDEFLAVAQMLADKTIPPAPGLAAVPDKLPSCSATVLLRRRDAFLLPGESPLYPGEAQRRTMAWLRTTPVQAGAGALLQTVALLGPTSNAPSPVQVPVTRLQAPTALGAVRPQGPTDLAFGVDVSHHNGAINWDALRHSGVTFAVMKATQRTTFVDPELHRNQAEARRTMKRVGYYHFLKLGAGEPDARDQARHFVRTVGDLRSDEFMVMDFEDRGLDRTTVITGMHAFLDELEQLIGAVPFIYTSKSLTDSYKIGTEFARYPLWVVSYRDTPSMPVGWPGFVIWQFTSSGRLPGVSGDIDLNVAAADFVRRPFPWAKAFLVVGAAAIFGMVGYSYWRPQRRRR